MMTNNKKMHEAIYALLSEIYGGLFSDIENELTSDLKDAIFQRSYSQLNTKQKASFDRFVERFEQSAIHVPLLLDCNKGLTEESRILLGVCEENRKLIKNEA